MVLFEQIDDLVRADWLVFKFVHPCLQSCIPVLFARICGQATYIRSCLEHLTHLVIQDTLLLKLLFKLNECLSDSDRSFRSIHAGHTVVEEYEPVQELRHRLLTLNLLLDCQCFNLCYLAFDQVQCYLSTLRLFCRYALTFNLRCYRHQIK